MSQIEDDPTLPDDERPMVEVDGSRAPVVLGGRYTLEERVGVGSGAVVWRAFDEALSRTVAIKLLRASASEHPDAAARLRREAATAGRAAHPGTVAVYDTGVQDDVAWLALEHVAGPTLLDVLRHHPSGLAPQVAAAVAEQAAHALGHAHSRGLVHRDVKPANLLLTADGMVKLADFGVAAAVDDGQDPVLAGSRGYAPPEQLAGSTGADQPPVDVFALGVVLHECLTGRPAFAVSRRAGGPTELLAPRQVRPDVPRDLDAVVRRATRHDRAERYADGRAMAAALRPLVASDPFELVRSLVRTEPHGRVVPAAAPASVEPVPDGEDDGDLAGRVTWLWAVLGLVVLALTGALTSLAVSGTGAPDDGPSTLADIGVPVTRAELFDPYGSVGQDDTRPEAAVDGDPTTAWRTPAYPVPLRSLGTPGVGLWIDTGTAHAVSSVEVDLATGGASIELLASDTAPGPGTTEADWRVLTRAVRPGETVSLDAGGTSARYWLVWVTELDPVGETWQAAVTDLRFQPATGTS